MSRKTLFKKINFIYPVIAQFFIALSYKSIVAMIPQI